MESTTKNTSDFQKTIHIKGIGTITSIGELDMEKWIKSLLECKYVTD